MYIIMSFLLILHSLPLVYRQIKNIVKTKMKTAPFWSFDSYSIQPTICKLHATCLPSTLVRRDHPRMFAPPLTRVARQRQTPAVQTITHWPIHDCPYKTQSTFKSYT